MNPSIHILFQMAISLLLLSLLLPEVNAYMQAAQGQRVGAQSTSALSAWSIPAPPAFSTHSIGASWYNEVDPTARRRATYNDDVPLDYTFSAPGDDWPSSFDTPSPQSTLVNQPKQRINPLRRAAKWLRKSEQ